MAFHHHHRPSTLCCCCCCFNCNASSYSCCTSPAPSRGHHLSDPVPTHLYYTHNILYQNQYLQQQTHATITSLLCRIKALESSLQHHAHSSSYTLRDTAARVIQTHFRSFLVRKSRSLRHLKHLAFIKSTFNSLKSTFSNEAQADFSALSRKAMDLLLKLDSIQDGDPMIRDGKRSIGKSLVQFLDSIDGVVVKKHWRYVKATKNPRCGQNVNKSGVWDYKYRDSGDDQSELLQNLRDRVERISRLCDVSYAGDDEDAKPTSINHVVADEDGGSRVLISRRNGVSPAKNGVFVRREGVQLRRKKSVSFADNGNVSEVYRSSTCEPSSSGDVNVILTCLEEGSSSVHQGELLENISCEVQDAMVSSQRG